MSEAETAKKPSKSNDQLFNELQVALEDRNHFENAAAAMYDYIDNIQNQMASIGAFKQQIKNVLNNPPSKKPVVKQPQQSNSKTNNV